MEFVTFELAKKLKEKGFPQKTAGRYNMIDCFYHEDGKLFFNGGACDVNEAYTAPTISQVLKWLREEKQLYVSIEYVPKIENCGDFYYTNIQYIGDFTSTIHTPGDYDSYEEAALAGIEYVLAILFNF
jgi:hypothetical protein